MKGNTVNAPQEYRQNGYCTGKSKRNTRVYFDGKPTPEAIQRICQLEKERVLIPHSHLMDSSFKRLTYTRYADDFICGVIGSKEDARRIKADIKDYLVNEFSNWKLSEEKTPLPMQEIKRGFWVIICTFANPI